MIFWRAVQGFIGGGMIPTVFASAYMIFPRSRIGLIMPLIGLVATLAPTIGPTVGGYLTERCRGTGCSSSTSCRESASPSPR